MQENSPAILPMVGLGVGTLLYNPETQTIAPASTGECPSPALVETFAF